jgi:hypothetical protein
LNFGNGLIALSSSSSALTSSSSTSWSFNIPHLG